MQSEEDGEELTLILPAPSGKKAMLAVSSAPSPTLEEAISESTNLIDDSAKHLFGLMKGLDPKDSSEVMTACEVAKQIQNLARVKLDYIRTMKSLKPLK